jgi:hypothetical protein
MSGALSTGLPSDFFQPFRIQPWIHSSMPKRISVECMFSQVLTLTLDRIFRIGLEHDLVILVGDRLQSTD